MRVCWVQFPPGTTRSMTALTELTDDIVSLSTVIRMLFPLSCPSLPLRSFAGHPVYTYSRRSHGQLRVTLLCLPPSSPRPHPVGCTPNPGQTQYQDTSCLPRMVCIYMLIHVHV